MDATQERWEEVHNPVQGPVLVRDEETQSEDSQRTREGEGTHGRPAAASVEYQEGLEGQNSHMVVGFKK